MSDENNDIDRLLHQAFTSRPRGAGSPSLVNVRHRARRHQRRRVGGALGATAVLGVSGVAVLAGRGGPESGIAGDSAMSTTLPGAQPICGSDFNGIPQTTIEYFDEGTSTTVTWPTTTILSEATTTVFYSGSVPVSSGCIPPGQFRCVGPIGTDDQGYTHFEYCEPVSDYPTVSTIEGMSVQPGTTVIDATSIMVVDASGGLSGASSDMVARLSESGLGMIQTVTATRIVPQTMLMPVGDPASLEIIRQLSGIDGFDTWTSDLIDGPLAEGTRAVIVIGQDYWDRPGAHTGTTVPPDPTTTVISTTTT